MAIPEKPLYYLTIHEAQKLIQSRALSPVELTRAVLDRIKAVDEKLPGRTDSGGSRPH
jgi:Asp-tRNAAsn/Glu-tRNAGln amidotransferase A subunit and related amidases